MPLHLIAEVVEGGIMEVEDRIIPQTPAIIPTEVVVEGVDMAKMGGTIPTALRSHNASCVASLVIPFRFVITDLISPIKALKAVILLPQMLVIQTLCLLWLPLLIILQMTLGILTLEPVII